MAETFHEAIDSDVVVIGAGISGLTAAYNILKRCPNMKVTVLEAKDRVGGRTLTEELKAAQGTEVYDLGGQWVGSTQTHIMELIEELGLETVRQHTMGRKYMQLGGNKISSYASHLPSLSLLALIDLHRFISRVESMQKCVSVSDPYNCDKAALWDGMTVETFQQQFMWTKAAKEALDAATRCMLGAEVSQISLLYYLMYVAAAGSIKTLVEAAEGSAQEFTVKGGTQQISERLAGIIRAKNILTRHPVHTITQSTDAVCVTCREGQVFRCKRLIIATPPHLTGHMEFKPALPIEKKEIFQRMPVSLLTKVIITYKASFWRDSGDSGELVTNGGPIRCEGCDCGPVCITYDVTSANGNPALVVFLGGQPAIQWSRREFAQRQRAVLETLCQVWGDQVYNFIDYREKDWSCEPYSEGGPVCCVSPGGMKYFASGLRDPYGRIHFAGTESATAFCGYMSGAVQAGIRAATEVLHILEPMLVTEGELKDTYYWPRPLVTDKPVSRGRYMLARLMKLTFSVGIVAGAVIVGRRVYFKIGT